jgi:hypothetical protein
MCTVTIVQHAGGVRLMSNRDERRGRSAALPPQTFALNRRRAAFPVDPAGGGTWVGVNDAGLVVTLLNLHDGQFRDTAARRPSRGQIVRALLSCGSIPEALAAASCIDARRFAPFRLLVVERRTIAVSRATDAALLDWSLASIVRPLLFTSSSMGDASVDPVRRRLFDRMMAIGSPGWLGAQARYHRHQWRSRPEVSVRMERPDALTVSRTTVDVTAARRFLTYRSLTGDAAGYEVTL